METVVLNVKFGLKKANQSEYKAKLKNSHKAQALGKGYNWLSIINTVQKEAWRLKPRATGKFKRSRQNEIEL